MCRKSLLIAWSFLMVVSVNAQEFTYIFGGPTDSVNGQFAGGLNDWVADAGPNGEAWTWTADGSGADGAYWGNGTPIASSSVSNGAAILNSDFLDNGGVAGNFGGGDAPSPHEASLVSPSFSCEGHESVVVMFTQYIRVFDVVTSVGVSIDGGSTWVSDTINDDIVTNFSSRSRLLSDMDEMFLLDFSEVAAGQPDVKVRFTFSGDYYAWIIDDVAVIEKPAHDVSLGAYFMPVNLATPASQIPTDTSGFIVEVTNNGSEILTDLVIKLTVTNDAGDELYSDSTALLAYEPGDFQDIILPGSWAPGDLEPGGYTFTYEAITSADQPDANPQDNIRSQEFFISNTNYTKEYFSGDSENPYFIGAYVPGNNYLIGNQYFTSNEWPANAGLKATTAGFAVTMNQADAPIAGKSVTVNLIEITDEVMPDFSNFDFMNPLSADNPQFEVVGIASYTFTQDDDDNIFNSSRFSTFVELELNDFITFDPGVSLKAGTRYLLAANYVDNNNTVRHVIGNQTPGRLNLAQYYSFSTFIYDAGDGRWYSGFFGGSSPVMNMTVEMETSADEVALPEHTVNVFPNPAPSNIWVDLNFETPSKGIVILANIEGKVLEIKEFSNTQQDRLSFSVNDLANGTYLVRVATDEGTKTNKVIVQK